MNPSSFTERRLSQSRLSHHTQIFQTVQIVLVKMKITLYSFEEISILRYYNCQKYHHKGQHCQENHICSKCGKNYSCREGRETTVCCNNCKILTSKDNIIRDTDHMTNSLKRSVYQKKRENAIKNICYE